MGFSATMDENSAYSWQDLPNECSLLHAPSGHWIVRVLESTGGFPPAIDAEGVPRLGWRVKASAECTEQVLAIVTAYVRATEDERRRFLGHPERHPYLLLRLPRWANWLRFKWEALFHPVKVEHNPQA